MKNQKIDLMSIWTKDKKELEVEELEMNLEDLVTGIGSIKGEERRAVSTAQKHFSAVVKECAKTPNARKLYDAYISLKAAKVKFNAAVELIEIIDPVEETVDAKA